MNKRTIIISSTKHQAKWSLKYIKNNLNEDVVLVATTIISQLELLKNGYDPFTYLKIAENLIPIDSLYNPHGKTKLTFNTNPNNITHKIINYLEKNNFFYKGLSIGKILSYPLYIEVEKICYLYCLFTKIQQKYHPDKIFIEKTNTDYLKTAFRIFTTRLIKYNGSILDLPKLDFKNNINALISFFFDKIISLFRIHTLTQEKKIIFQSGGNILYYFHNFLILLKRKTHISYLLLTFKQTVKDNLALLKQDIYPINISSIYPKYSNSLLNTFIILEKKIENNLEIKKLSRELNFKKKVEQLIIEDVTLYIKRNLKQILINIDKALFLLSKTKPKIFITTHDPGVSSMPYVLAAKKLKIKNAQIQHGLYLYSDEADYYSDLAIVWGKETKKSLETRLKKKDIYVAGFSGFDKHKRDNYILNNEKVIFSLLLTIYKLNDAYFTKFLHDLFPILAKYKQFEIRIRTHPGQNTSGYSELAKFYDIKNIKINPVLAIHEYVKTSNIILSMDTTAILWAMYYQKPLFYTCSTWGNGLLPVEKYKAAWIPGNATDLACKLKEFIEKPDIYRELLPGQNKFLEDFAGPMDGNASERLCNIIDRLIERNDFDEKKQ